MSLFLIYKLIWFCSCWIIDPHYGSFLCTKMLLCKLIIDFLEEDSSPS
jgi:hypothetical protein